MPSALDDAVTAALDHAWAKIQKLEPDVPEAKWYLTNGRSSSCATGPWNNPDDLVLRINLKLPKEPDESTARNRGAEDILGQLLHWAAHAATGISTGAEGRYHNREFGEIAEKLGLEIKYAEGLGWAPVPVAVDGRNADLLSAKGQQRFRAEIKALDKAMQTWEPESDDAARKTSRGPLAMQCSCTPPRVLRAHPGVALGPDVVCSVCGKPFRIAPGQRKSEADRA
jgi:hypothetical protein